MVSARLVFLFLLGSAFVADATLMQQRHGAHHTARRHIQKSMVLKKFGTALAQENKKNATPASLAQTKGAGWDKDADDEDDTKKASSKAAPSTPPLIGKLKGMLGELKERRENVVHLETTLKQLESMLQESKRMHSVASTEKAQATYLKQVKDTQQIYKNTFVLYEQSREEASDAARKLSSEMNAAKEVEESILGEAKTQLKHYENFPVHNVLDDDEDDDASASKHSKGSFLAKKADATEADDDADDDDKDDKDDDADDQ